MKRSFLFLVILLLVSCRTPDGPRIPLTDQSLSAEIPPSHARVVFFNTSNKIVYPTSGSVRIQLDGQTVPTVHFDRYVQIFVEPGEYDLLLEHFDAFGYFTSRHRITISAPESFFAVYSQPVSTAYEQVPALPENFETDWSPAKYPSQW